MKVFITGATGFIGRQLVASLVGITKLALTEPSLTGPVNLTAPNPVTSKEFAASISRVMGRPSWLPVPAFALRLIFGEGAALMLEGQRIMPTTALAAGYMYQFADLDSALADLL